LATYALLPVLKRFIEPYGIKINSPDISLAARIISQFSDVLKPEQRKPDALSALGELTQHLEANIIKLPNISASIPQLNEAIAELQSKGYNIPNFPQNPKTPAEEDAAARYAKVLGSAVNPVIREG
jgi:isocitrate dehydrogenase